MTGMFYGLPQHASGPAITTQDRADLEPVAQAIVVFRGWRVRKNAHGLGIAPLLRRDADQDWVPADAAVGRVEARCHCTTGADGKPVSPRHQCGFYGYKEHAYLRTQEGYVANWIVGMAVLSGRIMETERGYRGAKATPLALLDHQPHAINLEDAWRDVPLPALPLDEILKYGRQFGFVHKQLEEA